jgi:hypothetical protein
MEVSRVHHGPMDTSTNPTNATTRVGHFTWGIFSSRTSKPAANDAGDDQNATESTKVIRDDTVALALDWAAEARSAPCAGDTSRSSD